MTEDFTEEKRKELKKVSDRLHVIKKGIKEGTIEETKAIRDEKNKIEKERKRNTGKVF